MLPGKRRAANPEKDRIKNTNPTILLVLIINAGRKKYLKLHARRMNGKQMRKFLKDESGNRQRKIRLYL